MAGKYGKGGGGGGGAGRGSDGGRMEKFSLPGPRAPLYPLCTPAQIRHAELSELRMDDRVWAAYERGWFDLMTSYMSSQLMQGEMPAMYCNAPLSMYPAGQVADNHGCVPRPPTTAGPLCATEPCQGECHGTRGQCCCKCEQAKRAAAGQPLAPQSPGGHPHPTALVPHPLPRRAAPVPPVSSRPAASAPREGGTRQMNEIIITATGCSPDAVQGRSKAVQSIVKIRIVSPESTAIAFTKSAAEPKQEKPIPTSECDTESSIGSYSECDSG
ncbi:uncharacterized protein LOC112694310 isoform X2 [Sipha flava]|nr:uncharacterized protein LOC112694310 isoform X2 [Sipha flava]XP_025425528.1 uncharacterized protein LOC112694310 isoform X2 [Sipha flava]